jgi:hypothetical protein
MARKKSKTSSARGQLIRKIRKPLAPPARTHVSRKKYKRPHATPAGVPMADEDWDSPPGQ